MSAVLKPLGPGVRRDDGLSDAVLHVSDLSIEYRTRGGNVRAVRDVSFSIGRGETFGVVGESGSGKSTLAFAVMGYLSSNAQVSGGRIDYQGENLLTMRAAVGSRRRMARASVVLPEPDSPTTPSVSPARSESETSSTAFTTRVPRPVT